MNQINEDVFNMSLRKFLKQVGITSQREIENIARSLETAGKKSITVKMVMTAEETSLDHVVEGEIELR